jgi:hypothetical protein
METFFSGILRPEEEPQGQQRADTASEPAAFIANNEFIMRHHFRIFSIARD